MKKISNNVKISVGKDNKNYQTNTNKINIKASLNQIERLSQQIDQQISSHQHNHNRLTTKGRNNQFLQSSDAFQTSEENNDHRTKLENQQDSEQECSKYQPDKQNNTDRLPTKISKAIKNSIGLYLFLENKNSTVQNVNQEEQKYENQATIVDPNEYEQYKRLKFSNKDFKELVFKLQALRKHSLPINQNFDIKNQSQVLSVLKNLVERNSQFFEQQKGLRAIMRLQEIQQAIQSKVQMERDSLQHKKKIIQALRSDQKSIQEDIELLISRNTKLERQLKSINGKNNSVQDSSSEQEAQQQESKVPVPIENDDYDKSLYETPNLNDQKQEDYEQEYIKLMEFYLLYNPETKQIEQQFPKNKTQAMMFLNKLETKIQQLEMQKLISHSQ